MAYAQIDDNMAEHPKVERLSDAAFRAFVTSICFCSRNLTDGLILKNQAMKVGASPKVIRELVDGGCWDNDPDGWRVHDYLRWNKSRAEVQAFRESQRAKGRASGAARGSANGSTAGSTEPEPLVEPSSPSPLLSSPSPLRQESAPQPPASGGRRAQRALEGSRRQRDQAALASLPATEKYFRGPYGEKLRQRMEAS